MRQRNILFDKKLLKIHPIGGDAADYSPVARRSQATVPTSQNATADLGNTTAKTQTDVFVPSRDLAKRAAKTSRQGRIAENQQMWESEGASSREDYIKKLMQEQIGNSSGSCDSGIPGDATFQNMVAGYMNVRDIVHEQGIDLQKQLAWQQQHGNMASGNNGMMGNNTTAAAIGAGGSMIASLTQAFMRT